MKRGHVILISGGALLIIGIVLSVIWSVSFASMFLADNTFVAQSSVEPGGSIEAKRTVNDLNRPLSLAVGVDERQAIADGLGLRQSVTDPQGKVVSSGEFVDSYFTTIQPEMTGTYTVTISNVGTRPVSVSGVFGYMPFVGADGKPDIEQMTGSQSLGVIMAGGGLIAAGIIVLIAGLVITVLDRDRSDTRTTTEGGITYRKD
jgi:hypothetical protein